MRLFNGEWGAVLVLCILMGVGPGAFAQDPKSTKTDAVRHTVPRGTLVIVGGGSTKAIQRHFVELAGGDDADVVCVPTAHPHGKWSGWCRRLFRRARVPTANRTYLHTRDRETADTEAFVAPLRDADAVWFTGGRQWRLVEAYAGTQAEAAFRDVLERGGVIGGSSAGASIQGSFLIRGDPKTKTIVVGKYTDGFGYLPNAAIDQHVLTRGREYDLISVVEARPHLLGLGIDEGTAAIVHGDTLRVMGKSKIAVYDAQRWTEEASRDEKFFLLYPGDRMDLQTREVMSRSPKNP